MPLPAGCLLAEARGQLWGRSHGCRGVGCPVGSQGGCVGVRVVAQRGWQQPAVPNARRRAASPVVPEAGGVRVRHFLCSGHKNERLPEEIDVKHSLLLGGCPALLLQR